jgi:Ca-activated chloride channel homolog
MKMKLAKEAAAATASLLGSRDLIGVVGFDHRPKVVVELTYAANRSRISNLIHKIYASGGTDIVSALDAANNMLCEARAKVKHMILLSDGQSGRDRLEDVLQESSQCGISISVVGVGSDVDKGMMELIKERGQGRSYYTTNPHDLPKIFTKEASKVSRPPLVDEPIKVKVVKHVHFLKGINMEKAPYLLGYVPVKAKKQAEVILSSDLFGEPILARWNVGAGKAIAFTSDIKPRWARQWIESWGSGFQKFWVNLIRDSIRVRRLEDYSMTVTRNDHKIKVVVDAISRDSKWRNLMESKLTINKFGSGKKLFYDLKQSAPGRYTAEINLPGHGTYLLGSKHFCSPKLAKAAGIASPSPQSPCRRKRLIGEAFSSISYSYPKELKLVQPPGKKCIESPQTCPGLSLLQNLSSQSGGGKLDDKGKNAIFRQGEKVEKIYFDRWFLLIWPFLLIFIMDLLFRRIRLFGFRTENFE